MTSLIKICGLTTPETLDAAIGGGASHVGFVNFAKSPRHLSVADMAALRKRVPAHVKSVVLLVDPDAALIDAVVRQVAPDIIQLHGYEQPADLAAMRAQHQLAIWKALPVRQAGDLEAARHFAGAADLVLFDAPAPSGADLPGGNGVRIDWSLLAGQKIVMPWGLAGGLTPDNVAAAIRTTGAPLVDVSSGVESAPGIKDVDKIVRFCKAVAAS